MKIRELISDARQFLGELRGEYVAARQDGYIEVEADITGMAPGPIANLLKGTKIRFRVKLPSTQGD